MKRLKHSDNGKTYGTPQPTLLLALFILVVLRIGSAQEQKLLIPVNLPDASGLLHFENPKGSIAVTGYDGNMILVTATPRFNNEERKSANEDLLSYLKEESKVTLFCASKGNTIDVDIKLPRNFSLQLRVMDNGDVTVIRIQGDIVVDNTNGSIVLDNISGSAVLNSVYGPITARFKKVRIDAPIMITTLEGDIELALPADAQGRFKLKSTRGSLISDDLILHPVEKSSHPLADWDEFTLGNSKTEFILRTYNGDITINKYQREQ